MKVLMINGSPHAKGNTYIALHEMEKVFEQEGIETEILHIGNQAVRGCIACGSCAKNGKCVFDDAVNEAAPNLRSATGSWWQVRCIMLLPMQLCQHFWTGCFTVPILTRQ